MPEYIGRKTAELAMRKAGVQGSDRQVRTWAKAECIIHLLPAADVEPVIHAHWSVVDEYLVCSHCGERYKAGDTRGEVEYYLAHGDVHKRCHECGAHMDEDERKGAERDGD